MSYRDLVGLVSSLAGAERWLTEPIGSGEVTLQRVRDEKDRDYTGRIVIYLHEDCDPLRLEFDRDLYVQEFVKTQFASVQIHIRVLKLLKAIEPYFRHLNVEDEGEWWETENISNLTEHFSRNQQAIEAELRKRQPLNRRTSFSCAAPTEVAEEELAVDCGHCINRLNVRVRSTSGCVAASDCEGPN